jgi:threonine/homoserine/homoserine lactone efflux protein
MTDFEPLFLFASVALLITMTPGLDTVNVLRTSASAGSRNGIMTALGIGVGCLIWGSAVALGLGSLIAKWKIAFLVLQWIGAVYLVWIGGRTLLSLRRPATGMIIDRVPDRTSSTSDALKRGFTTNILNPKVGLFYMTLLPRFIPSDEPAVPYALVLAGIHVLLAVAWFTVLALATSLIRHLLSRPRVSQGLDLVTGCLFIGFGASFVLVSH